MRCYLVLHSGEDVDVSRARCERCGLHAGERVLFDRGHLGREIDEIAPRPVIGTRDPDLARRLARRAHVGATRRMMGTAQNGMQRSCTPGKDRAVRVELMLERVTIEITDRPVTGARDRRS